MKDAFSQIIFTLLRLSGHFGFSFDSTRNIFIKSKIFYIYSILQSLACTVLCILSTLYIFYSVGNSGTDKVRFDLIITTATNYCACAIIVFEKVFRNLEFMEINNRIWQLYFGKYYNVVLHTKKNRWRTFIIIFILYIILPVAFAVLNILFLVTVVNDLKELICIIIILFINLWIFLAILPVILLYWILRNILYFLTQKIELISNKINENCVNEIDDFSETIDDISIKYNELMHLILRVTKLFTMHLLINLFIIFFHLSFNSYLALLYIERGVRSFDNFNWVQTSLFIMTISYYAVLVTVIIHSAQRLISQDNELRLCMYDLRCDKLFRRFQRSVI